MATSPTVLANGSSSPSSSATPPPEASGLTAIRLILVIVASVIAATLGIGGGFFYLVRSGRLSMSGNVAHKVEVVAPTPTHVIVLEPLLVNLADSGGSSYLKVVVALRVASVSGKKVASPKEQEAKNDKDMDAAIAPIRDTLLTVLSKQTADELLAAEGKERLKTAMKAALAEHNPDMKTQDVFFTDFLVQR